MNVRRCGTVDGVRDDVTDGDGGDGWKEGGDEEIVVNVVS